MKDDLKKKTKQGLFWTTNIKIINTIYRFGISIAIARILNPNDFGIMAIATMVIYYANSLTDFGFTNALVQKEKIKTIHINSVFIANLVISLLLSLLILFLSPYIAKYFGSPETKYVLIVLSSVFILTSFQTTAISLFRRNLNFKLLSIITLAQSIFQTSTTLLLAIFGFKYWSLVIGHVCSLFLATLILLYNVNWKPRIKYSHVSMKQIYNFGLWNFVRGQLYFLYNYIPQFLIGRFWGTVILGNFEKAHGLASMPHKSVGSSINTVMFSLFSRLQNNQNKLQEWLLNIFLINLVVIVPILSMISAIAPHIIIVLLGKKWSGAILPLQLLSLGNIFASFDGVTASLNIGVGDYKRHTIRRAIGTLSMIVSCLLLMKWNIFGICIAYNISAIIRLVLSVDIALENAKMDVKKLFGVFWPYILVNLIMYMVIRYFSFSIFKETSFANMVALIFVGSISYLFCLSIANLIRGKSKFFPIQRLLNFRNF